MRKRLLVGCLFLSFFISGGLSHAAEPIKLGAFFDLTGPSSAIGTPTKLVAERAANPTIEQMKVPAFMTVGGDAVILGGKFGPFRWTFKSPQRTSVAVRKVYAYMKKKGMQKIAIITSADGFGRDGKSWLEKLAPEYGLKIIGGESFQATDNDMTTQLIKIKAASPEAIICWTIGKAGSIVAKNATTM